ncbi:TetR family transcriptional regulator [Microbacterium mangrovi]|uniref:TetR family transcriptional regulator n=1 Tax=Microbacterium mangrovi TaxID=1348253 RepID=A0A0B2A6B2_9MICO|nr:TetR/AcrR family transcriptional regulator [Microbacterium mangrovi]KHK98620.1 TetR family transcriptional regulator [Microbacterium mangrovi]
MAETRDRALDAAVRVVGDQGVRALTHGRVDAEAGLPKGSTSNWFRTRDALLSGVLVWIAEQERAELTAAMAPAHTPDEVADALCGMLESATGLNATRTRARYALFLEVTAAPGILPVMRTQRGLFEEWTRDRLADLGAPDPESSARTLLALCAGLIVNRLTVAPDMPVRESIDLALRGALAG